MSSALILSVIVLLSSCCEGHKILVYSPKLFWSHVGFMGRIADILVGAGHDVVVLMPDCDGRIKTNGTLLARTIHASCKFDGLSEMLSFLDDVWAVNAERMDFLFHTFLPLQMTWALSSKENLICRGLLGDVELMRRLRNEKFDLGISEAFSFCGFGIFEKVRLHKYIIASNAELMEALTEPYGISYNPSHVPALLSKSNDVMSFVERMQNFIVFLNTYILIRFMAAPHILQPFEELVRRPYTLTESFETMARCPSVFVNTNILLDFPREVNSKVVFVGGITATQSGSLREEFKRLMDVSSGGVVLVSFGTIALSSRMPPNLKYVLVSVFRRFPEITFIWKYEVDDEVASDLPNVIKRKWVPQADLLGHRNMLAFVSQCGANGMGESLYAGVPMVCIPVFFDQMRVAKKAEKQRLAVVIHKQNFTAKSFQWALRTIIYDKSYSVSARRMSAMTKDVKIPMEEQISSRARIAIEMKKVELLDPSGRRLNCLQFFFIDVISIPLILIILLS